MKSQKNEIKSIVFSHPITNWVLSRMAPVDSRQEESAIVEADYDDCHGHGCYRADCCQGYGHAIARRHSGDSKGQVPSQDYAELRHPNNRWRL